MSARYLLVIDARTSVETWISLEWLPPDVVRRFKHDPTDVHLAELVWCAKMPCAPLLPPENFEIVVIGDPIAARSISYAA